MLISHKHTQLVLTRMDFIGSIQHLIITREGTCTAEVIRSGCPHVASPHFPRPEPTPALRTTGSPTDKPRLPQGSQRRRSLSGCSSLFPESGVFQVLSQPPWVCAPSAPTGRQHLPLPPQEEQAGAPLRLRQPLLPLHCGPRAAPGTVASLPATLPNGRKPKAWFPEAVPSHTAAASDRVPVVQPLMQGQHRPVSCEALDKGHKVLCRQTSWRWQAACPYGCLHSGSSLWLTEIHPMTESQLAWRKHVSNAVTLTRVNLSWRTRLLPHQTSGEHLLGGRLQSPPQGGATPRWSWETGGTQPRPSQQGHRAVCLAAFPAPAGRRLQQEPGFPRMQPCAWAHSTSSCNSCLCRAWSRLTTVWWTASSPSMSSSRSSIRMAVRMLFWGHRESLPECHACDAGPPTPHTYTHTPPPPEHSLQGAAFQTDLAGWKLWPWLRYSARCLQGLSTN